MIETQTKLSSDTTRLQFPQAQSTLGEVMMNTTEHRGDQAKPLRLLLPINACADSRWGVRYAVQRHLEGTPLEVVLLNVGEFITQWQVLRFCTQQEIAKFQSERAQAFIDEASVLLAAENIPCRGLFRQGDIVFSILDAAEELDCDEIAMPKPQQGVSSVFSRDIVSDVRRHRRDIPVVMVDSDGFPQ